MSALRILHYPTDTGGNPMGLACAERALGMESTVALRRQSKYAYPADLTVERDGAGRVSGLASRARFAALAARRFDVFHFNFGQTLLPARAGLGVDLPLLRGLGKTLFMTFQGCDARLHADCATRGLSCCGERSGPGLCTARMDSNKRATIAYASRWCHRVFCVNPDLTRAAPRAEFIPYSSVDPRRWTPDPGPRRPGPLRVLHAPTHRGIKGTDCVIAAFERIRDRVDAELVLVEGMTRDEAMASYRDADLLVDQLRVGWYGGLAVELMSMGTPVVAYIRDEDLGAIPPAMRDELPVVSATAETLADTLLGLLDDPEKMRAMGARSWEFVCRWHDPARHAAALGRIAIDHAAPLWPEDGGPMPLPPGFAAPDAEPGHGQDPT